MINISSVNQSGGITAHTVNNFTTEKKPRELMPEDEQKLKEFIRDQKIIHISVIANDSEALRLGCIIKDFYELNGGKVGNTSTFIQGGFTNGVRVIPHEDSIGIMIASQ